MLSWRESNRVVVPLIVQDEVTWLMRDRREPRGPRYPASGRSSPPSRSASFVALAIHDVAVLDDQRLHARRLASLLESSRAVASAQSAEEALEIVTRKAVELFDVTSCMAYEYDEELEAVVPRRGRWERVRSKMEQTRNQPMTLADYPVERQLLEIVRRRHVSSVSPTKISTRPAEPSWRCGGEELLTVPMKSVDGPMGLLTLWDATRRTPL